MNARLLALAGIIAIGATAPAFAQDSMGSMKPPMVGGAPMYPNKNIVQNASAAKNLTTLVTLVKDAGLVSTLEGKGPFTVFAPTNDAFAKLPAATVAAVQKPENKALLVKILTYHVVAGDYTAAKIADAIKAGNGTATLTTVQGEPLMASMDGDKLVLTDAKGGKSTVIIADVKQSNGVVHAIDTVLMPK
jgi:uncharacterized surface protein with fasciclin (FAS1) repeats